jgi:single-stranded-DNA-specific exonuclease
MKFKLIGEPREDIISTTLSNRKIENLELFLNPEAAEESDPNKFKNSEEGRDLLLKHMAKGSSIVILVDADADGYTSASIMWGYIKDIDENAKLDYIVHEQKAHGLTDKVMEEISLLETKPNLIIIPDSGSNERENIKKLAEKDIDVLVIDHHHVEPHEVPEQGVIINNQLCENTNDNFVGAGVVYKFIQGIDEAYGYEFSQNYLDLVSIGQVGDSSDISNPEIRKLVFQGLGRINNKFVKTALGQAVGLKKIIPKDLSFGIIPIVNAVTRVGTLEERQILFEALVGIGFDRKFIVKKKKKNKDTGKFDTFEVEQSLFTYVYEESTKIKARQNNIVKKLIPEIEENIKDDKGVLVAFNPNRDYPGLSGLIANKFVSKYDKPSLLLTLNDGRFTGSGRGHEATLPDFRKWCEDSNLVEFAQGHDNAFGIAIKAENIEKFLDYCKKLQKQDSVYEVDVITSKPSTKDCFEVDKYRELFGGKVSEPLIGFEKLSVPKKFISTRGSVLNIYSWGVGMVQFGHNPKLYEAILNYPGDNVTLNVLGTYSMNDWGGKLSPQVIIKDIYLIDEEIIEEEINEETIIF